MKTVLIILGVIALVLLGGWILYSICRSEKNSRKPGVYTDDEGNEYNL